MDMREHAAIVIEKTYRHTVTNRQRKVPNNATSESQGREGKGWGARMWVPAQIKY